jgi:hypothetical protein
LVKNIAQLKTLFGLANLYWLRRKTDAAAECELRARGVIHPQLADAANNQPGATLKAMRLIKY